MVISGIPCLQGGGVGWGRVHEEVVLQELGLTWSGLILARFEGGHVVERSHFPSYQSSQDEDITVFTIGAAGMRLQGWYLGWFVSLYWFGPGLGTVITTLP